MTDAAMTMPLLPDEPLPYERAEGAAPPGERAHRLLYPSLISAVSGWMLFRNWPRVSFLGTESYVPDNNSHSFDELALEGELRPLLGELHQAEDE